MGQCTFCGNCVLIQLLFKRNHCHILAPPGGIKPKLCKQCPFNCKMLYRFLFCIIKHYVIYKMNENVVYITCWYPLQCVHIFKITLQHGMYRMLCMLYVSLSNILVMFHCCCNHGNQESSWCLRPYVRSWLPAPYITSSR